MSQLATVHPKIYKLNLHTFQIPHFLDATVSTDVSLGTGYSLTHSLTHWLTNPSKLFARNTCWNGYSGQKDEGNKWIRDKGTKEKKGQWDNGTLEQCT